VILGSVTVSTTAGAQDAAKTHTLFMGADVSIGLENRLYAVRDVSGSSWVVDVNGKSQVVSARSGPIDIRISPTLKLTEISATIADLKGAPGYSAGNDPAAKLTRALVRTAQDNAGYQAAVNQAAAAEVQAQNMAQYTTATNNLDAVKYPQEPLIIQTQAFGASNSSVQASNVAEQLQATSVSAGADLELRGDKGLSQGEDAMEVSFVVSSEHRLGSPYVVTVTQFHRKGGGVGEVQRLIYAKALDPIGRNPAKVHFIEEGFPPGFELRSFEVHLYNGGVEIATNVAPNRALLTRDEAFEYVKMDYIGAHKGATLPAVPAMGKLPADLPARLAEGMYAETYFVRVTKNGLASGSFVDAACTRKVDDPYLDSVIKAIRFKPALDKGEPVEGVASVRLGELPI
jgi:hypothetical protein